MRFTRAWDNWGLAPDGWGSHVVMLWRDWEPSAGRYNTAGLERMLAARRRPCYVQIAFSLADRMARAPVDYTPRCHRRSLALQVGGKRGEVPDYGDPGWRRAYERAVAALAQACRGRPLVAGYWHAAGWNQETTAAAMVDGADWPAALRERLPMQAYLGFLEAGTLAALAAWEGHPVYLPAAPSPGGPWGVRARDLIARLLEQGARYMMCGLQPDNATATGIGERLGLGMTDIAGRAAGIGFEEGPLRDRSVMELYWMLLRARHWRADFVNLYAGTGSAGRAAEAIPLLPPEGSRWIVFRDAEHPPAVYTAADGKRYGYSGEPGCWGSGLALAGPLADGTRLHFRPEAMGSARWTLAAQAPVTLDAPGLPGGEHLAEVWYAGGGRCKLPVTVEDGRFKLPPGRYHRVVVAG